MFHQKRKLLHKEKTFDERCSDAVWKFENFLEGKCSEQEVQNIFEEIKKLKNESEEDRAKSFEVAFIYQIVAKYPFIDPATFRRQLYHSENNLIEIVQESYLEAKKKQLEYIFLSLKSVINFFSDKEEGLYFEKNHFDNPSEVIEIESIKTLKELSKTLKERENDLDRVEFLNHKKYPIVMDNKTEGELNQTRDFLKVCLTSAKEQVTLMDSIKDAGLEIEYFSKKGENRFPDNIKMSKEHLKDCLEKFQNNSKKISELFCVMEKNFDIFQDTINFYEKNHKICPKPSLLKINSASNSIS